MQPQLPSKPRTSNSTDGNLGRQHKDKRHHIELDRNTTQGHHNFRSPTTRLRAGQEFPELASYKVGSLCTQQRPWLLPHRKGNRAAAVSQAPKEEQQIRVTLACMHRYRRMGSVNQTISGQGLFTEARQGDFFFGRGKDFLFCSGLKLGKEEGRLDTFSSVWIPGSVIFLSLAYYYITASGFLLNRVSIVSLDTPIGLGGENSIPSNNNKRTFKHQKEKNVYH